MPQLFGGSSQPSAKKQIAQENAQQAANVGKALFSPEQVTKTVADYKNQGGAKWNQILANMGAGGGTGGPDVTKTISSQADQFGKALGALTDKSGFGSDPSSQMQQILQSVESGINPQYAVYG